MTSAEIRTKTRPWKRYQRAWQDEIGSRQRDLKKKDGYDESLKLSERLLAIWIWMICLATSWNAEAGLKRQRKQERKSDEREKANSFKPAPERKPKTQKSLEQTLAEAHPVVQ